MNITKQVWTDEAVRPDYSLSQAQHNKGNPDSEIKEVDLPEEAEECTLLKRL